MKTGYYVQVLAASEQDARKRLKDEAGINALMLIHIEEGDDEELPTYVLWATDPVEDRLHDEGDMFHDLYIFPDLANLPIYNLD